MADIIDFAALVQQIPDALLLIDGEVNLKFVNDAASTLLGWQPADWIGRNLLSLVHPDDMAMVVSSTRSLQSKRSGTPTEIRVRNADASWRWVELLGADALAVDGVGGLVVMVRDITQRRMWEVASGDTAVFQQLVQHGSSITLLLDDEGRVSSVNAAFTRLLGHDPTVVVGNPLVGFCMPGSASVLEATIELARATATVCSCEVAMSCASAALPERPIRFEIVNLLDDPVIGGFIVSGHDVSDLHRARRSLEHLARHDALTGLANRSVLIEELEQIIDGRHPAAAVFIDLDRFKPVNDLFGHEAGDELLCEVGERLRQVIRQGDLVARVGGDEFVVLATDVADLAAGQLLCERIDSVLAEPYLLSDGPVRLTASVGLAMADEDSTVTGLLADADLAMYVAKAERRGEPLTRDPDRQRTANERRRLADDLALGLQRGEVVAYLQPVVDFATGRTVGAEALARWNHPTLGTLTPFAFLDLAEDAGLDLILGDVVLHSALSAITSMPRPLRLGLNLSIAQLTDRDLATRIYGILRQYDYPAELLMVEITERDTLARRAGAGRAAPERTLNELREMGASLALDDFGTGYSSLTHIRRYTLQALKIDCSFVAGLVAHPEDRAVIAAVVGMADALGMSVVAEGVENMAQYDALRALGCTLAQGYLMARPMPPADLAAWIASHGEDWMHPAAMSLAQPLV